MRGPIHLDRAFVGPRGDVPRRSGQDTIVVTRVFANVWRAKQKLSHDDAIPRWQRRSALPRDVHWQWDSLFPRACDIVVGLTLQAMILFAVVALAEKVLVKGRR